LDSFSTQTTSPGSSSSTGQRNCDTGKITTYSASYSYALKKGIIMKYFRESSKFVHNIPLTFKTSYSKKHEKFPDKKVKETRTVKKYRYSIVSVAMPLIFLFVE
jgi:hypothetical protein